MPRTRTPVDSAEQDAALELARRVGGRIRTARRRAGMTQTQLAGDRYTKAYISALETGITRPSMVALNYVAERLGLPASHFLGDTNPTWTRLEVDMRLAAGDWAGAADGYRALLGESIGDVARAEVLRGLAEAEARLDHGREAIASAAESARLFGSLGRASDEALARYWLAYGTYLTDNEADARTQLQALLGQTRAGLRVEPEFEMRVLTALAAVESRVGEHARSLAYLEEARGLADDLDDRRRATFLFNLAISYRETGDVEAAIRVGQQGLALYRAAGAPFESATIENDLALAYLAMGNLGRATEMASEAHEQFEAAGDDRFLAAVLDTEAQIALAGGKHDRALALAARSHQLARETGNRLVETLALVTAARISRARGDRAGAEERYAAAAELARAGSGQGRLRELLGEWAELRAEAGDYQGAYELSAEAVAVN
ncbi:MAG TPA: tetratricopeptide repeat protein [Candidatus Limnocylindria bacterium]|nr:tetratricopeptide repeat protein [Candidatus Limnocylindria bacterium]